MRLHSAKRRPSPKTTLPWRRLLRDLILWWQEEQWNQVQFFLGFIHSGINSLCLRKWVYHVHLLNPNPNRIHRCLWLNISTVTYTCYYSISFFLFQLKVLPYLTHYTFELCLFFSTLYILTQCILIFKFDISNWILVTICWGIFWKLNLKCPFLYHFN